MLSHPEFFEQCAAQNVILYGGLGRIAKDSFQATYDMGTLIKMGDRLSSGPIPDTSFCTDSISIALAKVINSSHALEGPPPLSTVQRNEPLMGCADAETRFGMWLTDLSEGRKVGGWIIMDTLGVPVAIKKEQLPGKLSHKYGESSALLLQDVAMIGTSRYGKTRTIVAPRGAIASMQLSDRARAARRKDNRTILADFNQVEALLYSRMTGIDLNNKDWNIYYEREEVTRPPSMRFTRAFSIVKKAVKSLKMQGQTTIS